MKCSVFAGNQCKYAKFYCTIPQSRCSRASPLYTRGPLGAVQISKTYYRIDLLENKTERCQNDEKCEIEGGKQQNIVAVLTLVMLAVFPEGDQTG